MSIMSTQGSTCNMSSCRFNIESARFSVNLWRLGEGHSFRGRSRGREGLTPPLSPQFQIFGARGMDSASQSISFIFMQISAKIMSNHKLVLPLLWGWFPHASWKSWLQQCFASDVSMNMNGREFILL